jgi:hypothetical protein
VSIAADSLPDMRKLFQKIVDSGPTVADIFINDDQDELILNFLDGTRLVLYTEDGFSSAIQQKTNGKGGWI